MATKQKIIIYKIYCKQCNKFLGEKVSLEGTITEDQILCAITHICDNVSLKNFVDIEFPAMEKSQVKYDEYPVHVENQKENNSIILKQENKFGKLLKRTIFYPCLNMKKKNDLDEFYDKNSDEFENAVVTKKHGTKDKNFCNIFNILVQRLGVVLGGADKKKREKPTPKFKTNCPFCKILMSADCLSKHWVTSCTEIAATFPIYKATQYAIDRLKKGDDGPSADECYKLCERLLREELTNFDEIVKNDTTSNTVYITALTDFNLVAEQLVSNANALQDHLMEKYQDPKLESRKRRSLSANFAQMTKNFIENLQVLKDEQLKKELQMLYCMIYGGYTTDENYRGPSHLVTPYYSIPLKFVSMKSAFMLQTVKQHLENGQTNLKELIENSKDDILTYLVFQNLPAIMARLMEFSINAANCHLITGNTYIGQYSEFPNILSKYQSAKDNPILRLGDCLRIYAMKHVVPRRTSLFKVVKFLRCPTITPYTDDLTTICDFNGVHKDELMQSSLAMVGSIEGYKDLFYEDSTFTHMINLEKPITSLRTYPRVKNPIFDKVMEIVKGRCIAQQNISQINMRDDLNEPIESFDVKGNNTDIRFPPCHRIQNISNDCWLISAVNLISASSFKDSIVQQSIDLKMVVSVVQQELVDVILLKQSNVTKIRTLLHRLKDISKDKFESAVHGLIHMFNFIDEFSMELVEFVQANTTHWCKCNNGIIRQHAGLKTNVLSLNAIPNKTNTVISIIEDFVHFSQICDSCGGEFIQHRDIKLGDRQQFLFAEINSRPNGFNSPPLMIEKRDIEQSGLVLFTKKATIIGAIAFVNRNHFTCWRKIANGWLVIDDDTTYFRPILPNDLSIFCCLLFDFKHAENDDVNELDVSMNQLSFNNDINDHPNNNNGICYRVTYSEGEDIPDNNEALFKHSAGIGILSCNDIILHQDECSEDLLKDLEDSGIQFGNYDIRIIPGASPTFFNPFPTSHTHEPFLSSSQADLQDNGSPGNISFNHSPHYQDIGSPGNMSFSNATPQTELEDKSVQTSQPIIDAVDTQQNSTCDPAISKSFPNFKLNFDTSGASVNGQWSKLQFKNCFGQFPYVVRRRHGKRSYKQFFCPLCKRKDTEKALMVHLKSDHCFGKQRFSSSDICPDCSVPTTPTTRNKHSAVCFKQHFLQANIKRAKVLDKENDNDEQNDEDSNSNEE
uniref:USP domain-containing protein n=1 Tax=Panagrolaimus davidi TaxID=227884 RepID=A0A914PXK5_9BILA